MKKLLTIALGLLAGCTVIQPIVQTTRPYEGHFYDKTSVEAAVQSIELQEGESVWILSNGTLKRVLKNCR